jgi:hypothetical protein
MMWLHSYEVMHCMVTWFYTSGLLVDVRGLGGFFLWRRDVDERGLAVVVRHQLDVLGVDVLVCEGVDEARGQVGVAQPFLVGRLRAATLAHYNPAADWGRGRVFTNVSAKTIRGFAGIGREWHGIADWEGLVGLAGIGGDCQGLVGISGDCQGFWGGLAGMVHDVSNIKRRQCYHALHTILKHAWKHSHRNEK